MCGGISEQSAQALESVAGTKEFKSSLTARRFELPTVLPDELDGKVAPERHVLCLIEPQHVVNKQTVSIDFKVLWKQPSPPDKSLRGNSYYRTGFQAEASDMGAEVYFRCARDGASQEKVPIIKTTYSYWPPNGLISQPGNMRLVNEMAYRLAQQLNCLHSSGLTRAMPPEE